MSPRNCIGGSWSADHEARRAENAAPVGFLDGGVDRLAEPEIVGGYDQPVQCANSPWELNWTAPATSRAASEGKSNTRIVSRSGAAQVPTIVEP